MIRYLLLSIVFCISSLYTFSQQKNYGLRPFPVFDGITYSDIFLSKNSSDIWVCGTMGTIIHSPNGGITWENVSPSAISESRNAIATVTFKPDNKHGWAVGRIGTVFRTSDGGKTWDKIKAKTKQDFWSIIFAPDYRSMFAFSDYDEIFEFSDDGVLKNKIISDYELEGIAPTGSTLLGYGEGAAIYQYNPSSKKFVDVSIHLADGCDNSNIKCIKSNTDRSQSMGVGSDGYVFLKKTVLIGKYFQR